MSCVEILDQLLDFVDRLARHDHAGHARRPARRGQFDAGEPVAVGGDRPQHRRAVDVRDMQEDAVEIIAGFFGRDRELGVVDQPLQVGGGHHEAMRKVAGGQIGKVAGRQALKMEPRATRAQQQLAGIAGHFQRNLRALRELADDFVEHMGRHGGGAVHGDIRRRGFGRLQVEVGRFQRQPPLARFDQHVRQDRDGIAPLDDAMHMPQGFEHRRSLQRDLHRNIPTLPTDPDNPGRPRVRSRPPAAARRWSGSIFPREGAQLCQDARRSARAPLVRRAIFQALFAP